MAKKSPGANAARGALIMIAALVVASVGTAFSIEIEGWFTLAAMLGFVAGAVVIVAALVQRVRQG